MKKLIGSYIFLLLYLIAMVRPVIPLVEYGFKYDYFSKILCINKDKPKLQCNGKCQLSKNLVETTPANSDNDTSTIPTINLKDYPITNLNSYKYCLVTSGVLSKMQYATFQNKKSKDYINSVFRPPQNLV